ncbi:MAG TPA: SDR family NAD(P)-dependent oxidoreductase [Marmoricola sp.]|nr:SDR family NAD(P)-dependent oxidoreductase [Marmoricola sp.]
MTRSAAVVTGAGRGLGREIALLLGARGHLVAVTDVDATSAEATAGAVAEAGGTAYACVLDVRDEDACRSVAEQAAARAGHLAVWVNNAGVITTGAAWEQDHATRRLMVEVNALGTMHGTLAALEQMRPAGRGHVVNIVSLAGMIGVPGETVYSASKHAALGFSLATLSDLRLAGLRGIDISCVCPDGIWTPMLHDKLEDPAAALSFSGRLLQAADVARAVDRVLDRPRPVTAVPAWRGLQVRLLDALPALAVRLGPAIQRTALWQQRRYARRLGRSGPNAA